MTRQHKSLIEKIQFLCQELAVPLTEDSLYVSIQDQKLFHFKDMQIEKVYTISTSKRPPSCIENSYGTPWGMHTIVEKIGDGEPLGTVFKSRKSVNKPYWEYEKSPDEANPITTRILRLQGMQEGLNKGGNCDTFSRFVYIHSTDREHLIGTPISKGCVLLTNNEMLELFNQVATHSPVFIEK